MALPQVGAPLPTPALGGLDGVPGTFASLTEITGDAELLLLATTTEGAMTDRLRQTLVGLKEATQQWDGSATPGVAAAAVSMVPAGNLRKLARKANVEYPLLSDPGREWLGELGAPSDGSVALLLVSVPTATVLQRWDESKPVSEIMKSVGAALEKGRAALECEVGAYVAKARAVAEAAASAEAAAQQQKELAQRVAQAQKEAAAREKQEAQQRAAEELEALNRQMAEKLAAEAAAKEAAKKEKAMKKLSKGAKAKGAEKALALAGAAKGKESKKEKAAKLKQMQKAQKAEKAAVLTLEKGGAAASKPADEAASTAAAAASLAAAVATAPPPPPATAATSAAATVVDDYDVSLIRNFCIIAHIDHGKSTLADRLLQVTKTVEDREMKAQLLDNMDIERERGITIKLQAARMTYKAKDGKTYVLNLIDTPGHVDFQYEVSRSLAACEGALLVVDASQGVEAQTIANCYLAVNNELSIVPVLNKIDLPGADPLTVSEEIESTLGLDCSDAIPASAKVGTGVDDILEAIVHRIPPPADAVDNPLRALIFDSYYDAYRGVVVFVRVVDGVLRRGERIRFVNTGVEHEILDVGTLTPGGERPTPLLRAGEVGYVLGGIKSVGDARVGDTITAARPADKAGILPEPLPGYKEPVPVVFCGLFPVETTQYQLLRESLERLCLNDAALQFEPETSSAMGFGFRCGFLGLLHMEIIQERLEREYNLDLIVTAPSVVYQVRMSDGEEVLVDSPAKLADADRRQSVSEPYVQLEMFCPKEYSGTLMELAQERRGEYVDLKFLTERRCSIKYEMPLAEMITDFFDQMKSKSKGYASMEYSLCGYRENDLVRLDILINGEPALPLAAIVHRDASQTTGKALTRKLKELIPRQQFKVPIQAAIGQKIVASSQISPIRKDVLAKCYGGDISRKKKLLNKQAKGKKRMKMMGKVNVPQEAFMAVLNLKE